jgi:hypothetical protein
LPYPLDRTSESSVSSQPQLGRTFVWLILVAELRCGVVTQPSSAAFTVGHERSWPFGDIAEADRIFLSIKVTSIRSQLLWIHWLGAPAFVELPGQSWAPASWQNGSSSGKSPSDSM